jgi:phosphoglycolate phosphatase
VASLPGPDGPDPFPLAVRAIALDLDGTLVDTLPDLHEAGNRMLAGLGRGHADTESVRSYIGDGVDRLIKRLLTGKVDGEPDAETFAAARGAFTRHYEAVLTRSSRPYAGVPEALDEMRRRGFRLACITNKPRAFTEPLLAALGLAQRLDLVLSGDSLARKKPDPLPLQHCARSFGAQARELLMVGDSANDCQAARKAGCPILCVPYGYRGTLGLHELDCDAIVPSLSAILDLIALPKS